jgi:beta-phosphoglucomutase-like phosphatase (HAD superfamily)
MDRVLADSEPYICKAAVMMFAETGLMVDPEEAINW